jgi:uncharacterized protein (TIGR02996 family)
MIPNPQTQLSLLQGILSEPGEEAPRLVYADWLADHSDPLAELVRLHLEMDRPQTPSSHKDRLCHRERQILDGLGFGRALSAGEVRHSAYGGLPDGRCFAIVDGVPLLCLTGPSSPPLDLPPREWVERFGWFTVFLGDYDSYESRYEVDAEMVRKLFDWPLMERCIGLAMGEVQRFYGDCDSLLAQWPGGPLLQLGGFGLKALTSPALQNLVDLGPSAETLTLEHLPVLQALPHLRRLSLAKSYVKEDVVAALAGRLPELRSLDLSRNGLGDDAIQGLAGGAWPELVELDLSMNPLTDAGALALLRSPHFPRLRRLLLHSTEISSATVEELCRTDRLLRCGELRLDDCPIPDEGLLAVAESPHVSHLRSLTASSPLLSDRAAVALASSPHLQGLVQLFLVSGQIGPEGAEALMDGSLPCLEELTLRGNPIGDRGALALARFGHARGSSTLDLWRTGVTAEGVAALAASGLLAGLEQLWLDDNPIGDDGVTLLAACPDLARLRWLWLSDVGMTDEGARTLVASPYLPRSARLAMFGNPLSEAAIQELSDRFPGA